MRRRRVLTVAAISLALVAAGCGSDDDGDSGDSKQVTLRFSWWGSDTRHTTTKEVIAKFEAANPGIKVEPDFTGFDDYWDRLGTSVAGGNAPDVMQQDLRYIAEYADRGALADLNQFIPGVIDNSKLDPTLLPTGQLDGKTYAIPTGVNAYSIMTDPAVYKAAGVDVPDDKTWTWEDYLTTAAAITKGSPKGTYGTQNLNYVSTGFEIFARQKGESLFTESGDLGYKQETLKAWWEFLVKLQDAQGEPPPSVSVETQAAGVDQSLLATGKSAMAPFWTNQLPAVSAAAGDDLTLLRWPGEGAGNPGMYLKPAMFYSIAAKSKHPQEAAKLVNFLINDKQAADLILMDRGLPTNLDLRKAIVPELTPADAKSAAFLEEISPTLKPPPGIPPTGAGQMDDILGQLNEQVLFGRITVDEAVEQFTAQLKAAIS